MQKWEYKIHHVDFFILSHLEEYISRWEDELDSIGNEGWELVNVTSVKDDPHSPPNGVFVFKRAIE